MFFFVRSYCITVFLLNSCKINRAPDKYPFFMFQIVLCPLQLAFYLDLRTKPRSVQKPMFLFQLFLFVLLTFHKFIQFLFSLFTVANGVSRHTRAESCRFAVRTGPAWLKWGTSAIQASALEKHYHKTTMLSAKAVESTSDKKYFQSFRKITSICPFLHQIAEKA